MIQASRLVLLAGAVGAFLNVLPASVAHATVAGASKKSPATLREPMVRQMIVKLRNPKAAELVQPLGADRVATLANRAGVPMRAHRAMSLGASVLRLETPLPLSEARAVAARIAAEPNVAYAEPDVPVRLYQTVPPDASYALRQWHYFGPTQLFTDSGTDLSGSNGNKVFTARGGANLPGAWARTLGSPSIVVAVVDNGVVLLHPEVALSVLPGYDFVSSGAGGLPTNFAANDGNGRDGDPNDPGDWITADDKTNFPTQCDDGVLGQTDSTWHGTHMAGTIVGAWGNDVGNPPPPGTSTAGIAPGVLLLPVRALGKCGGDVSDVADAIVWAAGFPVPNVPNNPNPARIINLSLGSPADCGTTYGNAIALVSAQALVIAAAGNEALLGVSAPANCPGVLGVTAHAINGDNADYSNVGPEVGISSPGGGAPTQLLQTNPLLADTDNAFWTWSSLMFGLTTPTSTDGGTPPRTGPAIGGFTGTSGATAHVSGVAALVLSANPALTPNELRTVLITHTRPHPAGGFCATGQPGAGLCGSGLLDAAAAVAAVVPPPPSSGGGGGALPLAQLLLLGLFVLAAGLRRRT